MSQQLRGYDFDGVLCQKDGTPNEHWCKDLRTAYRMGHECVILTTNTDPEHVKLVAETWFRGMRVDVHRFKRSDLSGKAQWLHDHRNGRPALLIDDQWRYLYPCVALGIATYHTGEAE